MEERISRTSKAEISGFEAKAWLYDRDYIV